MLKLFLSLLMISNIAFGKTDSQIHNPNPVTATGSQLLKNKQLEDATTSIVDDGDNTKIVKFQVSGITTATTRTITVPDVSFTMVPAASPTFTGTVTLPSGSVTSSAWDTGTSTFTSNGVAFTAKAPTASPTFTGVISIPSGGSAGAPVIAVTGNTNTGIYSRTTNNITFTANGAIAAEISTIGIEQYVGSLYVKDGSVSAPGVRFDGDQDTGIYRIGANQLGISANGTIQASFDAVAGHTIYGAVLMPGLASSSAATTGTLCWTTVTGNVNVDTTVACLASTRKIKEAIEPLDSGIDEVMKLKPISYHLKKEFNPMKLGRMIGFVAEDVEQIDPRLVALDDQGDPKGVRYMQLTALLTKAIQEQQAEIEVLKEALIDKE